MNPPLRGSLYELALAGAAASQVVVISEDLWNEYTADCVVVPFFEDEESAESVVRPRLNEKLLGNCTRVTSLAQDDLGQYVRDCPSGVLSAVEAGVRAYLGIDELLDPPQVRPRLGGRADWWPRQGDVCLALRIAPDPKWVAIASEDPSNLVLGHAAAVRLTSTGPKAGRSRWEIPVRGGFAISNDLHLVPYGGFDPRPRISPPFPRLNREELQALAERLVATLEL